MRFKQLHYFQEVARTGSITAASSNLYITQQALSTALKNLEDDLHATLLKRSPIGVTLTDEGQLVLTAAQQIMQILADLDHKLAGSSGRSMAGEIRLILSGGLRQTFFPEIYSHFYKDHPQIKLSYSSGTLAEIETALLEDTADCGLATLPRIGQDYLHTITPQLVFTPIKILHFAAYVSDESPLARYKTISLRHLLKYPLVMQSFQTPEHYPLFQILSQYGDPQIIASDSAQFTQQMLKDNNAAALFPMPYTIDLQNVTPIKLRDNVSIVLSYLYHQDKAPLSPLLQLFIAHLPATDATM